MLKKIVLVLLLTITIILGVYYVQNKFMNGKNKENTEKILRLLTWMKMLLFLMILVLR